MIEPIATNTYHVSYMANTYLYITETNSVIKLNVDVSKGYAQVGWV